MSKKRTTEEYRKLLYQIHGNTFTLLSEYTKNNEKVKIKCNVCGNIIEKIAAKMICKNPEGCYICSGKNRWKTKSSLQQEVDKLFPNIYEILEEYVNARTPILVRKSTCNHVYKISPDNLLRGKGCPLCSIKHSSYMQIVEQILDKYKIIYEKEKIFSECKNIRPLPFDYYIPALNTCIEVDGEFHYPVGHSNFHNEYSTYEAVHYRDNIKTRFCESVGIVLLRLPYFQVKDFEQILVDNLHIDTEVTV